jgi:hypothetical protein
MPPVVRLKLRVRLADGSRSYLDPVYSGNNKLKPGYASVGGKHVHFPDGVYHLRYLKGSRRVWEAVGSDAQFALIAKLKREKSLEAKAAGVSVVEDEAEAASETSLTDAVTDYLEEVKAHKAKKTDAAYSLTLKLFSESCRKANLEDIGRKDVLSCFCVNFFFTNTLPDAPSATR